MSEIGEMAVSLESEQFPDSYLVRAIVRDREVGRLSAVFQSERVILLGDLRVEEAVEMRGVNLLWAPHWLHAKPKLKSFRSRGIGSMMLDHFFNWCREADISEVYGSVTQDDLERSPWLLDWYRRCGFEVRQPDGRCIGNAAQMIVWNPNE